MCAYRKTTLRETERRMKIQIEIDKLALIEIACALRDRERAILADIERLPEARPVFEACLKHTIAASKALADARDNAE